LAGSSTYRRVSIVPPIWSKEMFAHRQAVIIGVAMVAGRDAPVGFL
jgi:hypothetical protein